VAVKKAQWQPEIKQVYKCPAAKEINAQSQVANTSIPRADEAKNTN